MKKRAVIYARYSSDRQTSRSIDDQVRVCKELALKEGMEVIEIFTDPGVSGASMLERPGIQALLAAARRREFDVVLAEALDRVSRDLEGTANIFKRLQYADVELHTVAETRITTIHVGFKGTMNAGFLDDLKQKTRRGLEGVVRSGRSGGGISYGYDVAPSIAGGSPRGHRFINGAEAAIVRRIFSEYVSGKGPKAIVTQLNKEGIAGPRGRAWGLTTILGNRSRGTGLLNNELYIGRLIWNRLEYRKDPETGRRVSRLKPETEVTKVDVPDLRIIEQSVWELTKERQGERLAKAPRQSNGHRPWDRRRPRYLLSGLARCGACGAQYIAINSRQFGCSAVKNGGSCNNRFNFARTELEERVLGGLRDELMAPALFAEFAQEFERQMSSLDSGERDERATLAGQLERIAKQLKKAVAAFLEDDGMLKGALKEAAADLERQRDVLQRRLEETKEPTPPLRLDVAEVYRASVRDLLVELQDESLRNHAVEIIRSLVDSVLLTPNDDGIEICIRGKLAGILSLASPTGGGPFLEYKIMVVAGAGFEPTTFRL
jgi:site-specific DNA recombinase